MVQKESRPNNDTAQAVAQGNATNDRQNGNANSSSSSIENEITDDINNSRISKKTQAVAPGNTTNDRQNGSANSSSSSIENKITDDINNNKTSTTYEVVNTPKIACPEKATAKEGITSCNSANENQLNGNQRGAKRSQNGATAATAKKADKRRSGVILGDSMVKHVYGWELKEKCGDNCNVYVKSFPGATTKDMYSYSQPSIERKPDIAILHVGTNDLVTRRGEEMKSEVEIAQGIVDLADHIRSHDIEVVVSGIIAHGEKYLDKKREKVNFILEDLCSEKKLTFIDHPNIEATKHLNRVEQQTEYSFCAVFLPQFFLPKCKCITYCDETPSKDSFVLLNSVDTPSKPSEDEADSIGQFISHIDPKDHVQLVNIVGKKCTVPCLLNGKSTHLLWDSGAQVSLISEDHLKQICPEAKVQNISTLLNSNLRLTAANGLEIPFRGWKKLSFQLENNDTILLVPFLVTNDSMEMPLIGYNVIKELAIQSHFLSLQQPDLSWINNCQHIHGNKHITKEPR